MAKKITTVKRSDGTSETIIEQHQGFWHYFGLGFCVLIIFAVAIQTWWLGIGILLLLAYGASLNQNQKKKPTPPPH